MADTLDALGDKLKALAKVNTDLLDTIRTRREERVICGYDYRLNLRAGAGAGAEVSDDSDVRSLLSAEPRTDSVSARLDAWRYKGDALNEPEDTFNDSLDYTLSTYDDVLRLNGDLLRVGSKFPDRLADRPKNREDLRHFLTNMELLQVAIGQLHGLTLDMADPLSAQDGLSGGLEKVLDGFRDVRRFLPASELSLTAEHAVGKAGSTAKLDGGDTVVHSEHPEKLHCDATLEGHTGDVNSLVVFTGPDGTPCLASGSSDKTVRLWDLKEQKHLATLEGHTAEVWSLVVFTGPDGTPCLASGSDDHTVRLWRE